MNAYYMKDDVFLSLLLRPGQVLTRRDAAGLYLLNVYDT
jgi:hypothetical protein